MRYEVDGYTLETELYQGQTSRVYRARRDADGASVVLKLLKNEFPSTQELERHEREYRIASTLNLEHGVRVLDLVRSGYRNVIVYEDDGCISLRRMHGGRKLDVRQILSIGAGLAKAVAELHALKLVHNDLSPSNILIHPKSGAVKLTDFELVYSEHAGAERAANCAFGTLAYMAPEKTGRTSQHADHRSDLYSLGSILFELAAGRPPFVGLDDAALLHAHIALAPASVRELNEHIPEILDALIFKLLSKDSSDRYQTASGLFDDLQRLLQQWDDKGDLEQFPLGLSDQAVELLKIDRLYGRDDALRQLATAYASASEQQSPVWVSIRGVAGCGKSSLVNAFTDRLPGGQVVCTGRAERLEQSSPFAALIPAFSALLRNWLALPEEKLSDLRGQLQNALGVNAAVLEPLIPELPKLLGPLPKLLSLGATAEQTRFQLSVNAFLRVAAEFQNPLVIFVDDLHWADPGTLRFLDKLLTTDLSPCLLITAERDDRESDAVSAWHSRLSAAGANVKYLVLNLLSLEEIGELIDDSLGQIDGGPASREALAATVFHKTLGNPFFATQFIRSLVHKEFLSASTVQGKRTWRFDVARISQLDFADNVLDLLSQKISSLPDSLRRLLEHAACIGPEFDKETVARLLSDSEPAKTSTDLLELVRQGMLQAVSGANQSYSFTHGRIREAALKSLPEREREAIHWRIGSIWQEGGKRSLFDIVGQLNRGVSSVSHQPDRTQLAFLNAEAARAARAQTAYDTALEYAEHAVRLYPPANHPESPQDRLAISVLLADCQASAGQLDASIKSFEQALGLTRELEAQAQVLNQMADALQSSGQPARALMKVQRALAILGQPLIIPVSGDTAGTDALRQEQAALDERLSHAETSSSFEQLENADDRASLISRLYDKAIIGVYFTRPELLGFVTARALQHVLSTGLTPESGVALAWWSMILCMRDQHEIAGTYAHLARNTHVRFKDDYYGGGARMVATAMALCWTRAYADNFQEAGESARLLHQSGNLQFASYGLVTQHIIKIVEAADCRAMLQSCQRWGDYCERYVPLELGQARIRS